MFKHQIKTNSISIMKKHLTILSGIIAFMTLVAFTPISDSDGFYRIDTKESSVKWVASKVTGSTHEGTVTLSEGGLQIANGVIAGGKFTIDMTSINVTDLDGGMKGKLEGHLNSDDFFATEKFKTANLTIISADANTVKASITIKGITQEISFPVELKIADGSVTATAAIEIDRSKFDVRYGSDSFFDNLGNKAINNIIKFNVTLKGKA
jgi:polyisoprenoid-binding protein YceI